MQPYLPPEHQLLISLAKSEIWPEAFLGQNSFLLSNKQINSRLADLEPSGWNHLFLLAAQQGLLAIVWDALQKRTGEAQIGQESEGLPQSADVGNAELGSAGLQQEGQGRGVLQEGTGLGIPRALKIRWELSVRHIGEIHRRQRLVLKELAEVFAREGIRVMLLKGLGLAEMYPRPEHRESGDLDIYLFGDFEKGNKVIGDLGIEVEYDGTKHSKFNYKGIPVENHKNFLNVTTTRVDKDLERELMRMLQEQKCGSLDLGGITVDVPPPDFQMIFLTRHAITHFLASGLVLRHLYDFGIFYSAHAQEVDLDRIEKIFKRASQHKLYRAFLDVLQIYLGMPARKMKAGSSKDDKALRTHNHGIDNQAVEHLGRSTKEEERLAARVLDDIIRNPAGGSYKVRLEDMWVPKRKFIGAVRLFRFRWKYQLVEKNAFGNRFWRAIGHCFRKSHG